TNPRPRVQPARAGSHEGTRWRLEAHRSRPRPRRDDALQTNRRRRREDRMNQPAFIPTSGELSTLDRDLRFHPSTVTNQQILTKALIDNFNHDGYLKGIRIFALAEINEIRAYFDDLLARTLAAGGDSYSISTAHLRHGRVYDLLTHPRIVAYVADLLG